MKEYLQVLIWTMFFVVIVEMTFPTSNIKRYLKFVLGFVVLYVIVSPVADYIIATQYIPGKSFENYLQYYQTYVGHNVEYSDLEKEKLKQQEGLTEIYLTQLEEQVKTMLEAEMNELEVENISLKGELKDISFVISDIELEVALKKTNNIQINIGEKDESTVLSEVQLKKQIENYLNNFYNLDNTNIYITVQKN